MCHIFQYLFKYFNEDNIENMIIGFRLIDDNVPQKVPNIIFDSQEIINSD